MVAGRKPLAIEDKVLRGNPGKKAINHDAPKVEILFELPEAPDYLGEYGTREWNRTGPKLVHMRMLAETDLPAFEAYCMNLELLVQARLDIKKNGMTVLGHRGRVRNPAIAAFGQASTAIRGFVGEFGLSPSARSRIKVPTENEDILGQLMDDDGTEDFGEGL